MRRKPLFSLRNLHFFLSLKYKSDEVGDEVGVGGVVVGVVKNVRKGFRGRKIFIFGTKNWCFGLKTIQIITCLSSKQKNTNFCALFFFGCCCSAN